jgi:hypothetical protein
MSALEELWLWLQGRSSRTEAVPDTMDSAGELDRDKDSLVGDDQNADDEARIRRNWRYRAGPWQMK